MEVAREQRVFAFCSVVQEAVAGSQLSSVDNIGGGEPEGKTVKRTRTGSSKEEAAQPHERTLSLSLRRARPLFPGTGISLVSHWCSPYFIRNDTRRNPGLVARC